MITLERKAIALLGILEALSVGGAKHNHNWGDLLTDCSGALKGRFHRKKTFTLADLNDLIWSAAAGSSWDKAAVSVRRWKRQDYP